MTELTAEAKTLPEFVNGRLDKLEDFSFYRAFLYLTVRFLKPSVMVETGVLNGFGSAFSLLAMQRNDHGHLYSIDVPPNNSQRILAQGNPPLPQGKTPGMDCAPAFAAALDAAGHPQSNWTTSAFGRAWKL